MYIEVDLEVLENAARKAQEYIDIVNNRSNQMNKSKELLINKYWQGSEKFAYAEKYNETFGRNSKFNEYKDKLIAYKDYLWYAKNRYEYVINQAWSNANFSDF